MHDVYRRIVEEALKAAVEIDELVYRIDQPTASAEPVIATWRAHRNAIFVALGAASVIAPTGRQG